jgi:hypothetical protein
MKKLSIRGIISIPEDMNTDDLHDLFVAFLETKGCTFGGVTEELRDTEIIYHIKKCNDNIVSRLDSIAEVGKNTGLTGEVLLSYANEQMSYAMWDQIWDYVLENITDYPKVSKDVFLVAEDLRVRVVHD